MPERRAEIVVVDDDRSVLKAMSRQISLMGHRPVVFDDPRQGVCHVREGNGDCLLLDLQMPDASGLDVQDMLSGLPVPIVFVSGFATIPATVQAMQNGAVTFLEKPVEYAELELAIETALKKGADLRANPDDQSAADELLASLTERQKDVFRILVTGVTNKEIAQELGIGERTVKAHRHAIMERLEADSIADIYRLAARLGLN
ncbi:response regulator transcription factor [Primorskyibacter sp. S87]|uniref:response regulator transcription factor n=1 Tax=Primorskyibacter sp. S87 TaxID=3415126 RepID=UPI003C797822